MATLGAQLLDVVHMNPMARLLNLQSAADIAANNATYNIFDIVLPEQFSQADLLTLTIRVKSAQTLPAVNQEELPIMTLLRNGQELFSFIPAERTWQGSAAGTATNPDSNFYYFLRPLPALVLPNDVIRIIAPPADDGGSPTGDYSVVGMTLQILEF